VCFNQQQIDKHLRRYQFYAIFLVISAVFLAATLLIYALLKDLRNLQGKILICHVSSLLVGYSLLSFVQFTTDVRVYHCICIGE